MTDFECFKLYMAIKLHFTDRKYSYFKYNGKVSFRESSFEIRRDRYHFYALNNKHPQKGDLLYFIVSNLVLNPKCWVGDLLGQECEDNYSKFKSILQSLKYIFDTDCRTIYENSKDPFESDGGYPPVLRMYLQGEVHLEVMCILNEILNFIPSWDEKIKDTIVWPDHRLKILKYSEFLKLDYDSYENYFKENYLWRYK